MEIKDNKIKKDILGSYVYRSSFNPFNIPNEEKNQLSQRPRDKGKEIKRIAETKRSDRDFKPVQSAKRRNNPYQYMFLSLGPVTSF